MTFLQLEYLLPVLLGLAIVIIISLKQENQFYKWISQIAENTGEFDISDPKIRSKNVIDVLINNAGSIFISKAEKNIIWPIIFMAVWVYNMK
mgnify:CR=1 FL=1